MNKKLLILFVVVCKLTQTCFLCLSDVTSDLFSGSKNGVVAAFGNFNADKLTDIFVIAEKGKFLLSTIECSYDSFS